jgi:hypothetical protein
VHLGDGALDPELSRELVDRLLDPVAPVPDSVDDLPAPVAERALVVVGIEELLDGLDLRRARVLEDALELRDRALLAGLVDVASSVVATSYNQVFRATASSPSSPSSRPLADSSIRLAKSSIERPSSSVVSSNRCSTSSLSRVAPATRRARAPIVRQRCTAASGSSASRTNLTTSRSFSRKSSSTSSFPSR